MERPSFYDPRKAAEIYFPDYGAICAAAQEFARQHAIQPSALDAERTALFVIDPQLGFCHPKASLYVPGAEQDMARTAEFIYDHLAALTNIYVSLDTHRAYQIFYPTFWLDDKGEHPAPFTIITYEEALAGKYRPARHHDEAMAYLAALEQTQKYRLMLWPFHTMLGAIDHAMVPLLFEAVLFHSLARKVQTHFETKGEHPLTENYSVLGPEVEMLNIGTDSILVGGFNSRLVDALMQHDKVYIAGEASSHCVRATIEDLLGKLRARDPAMVKKVYILADCMSPVPAVPGGPDFPALARQALDGFAAAGFNVVKSTAVPK